MLAIIRNIREANILQLMPIYEESNLKFGREICPHGTVWEQLRLGEDFHREDITEFLTRHEGILALWIAEEAPVAALRLEPYCDGFLLSCLETAPKARRKGAATMLISSVIECYSDYRIYVHIRKNNAVSMKVHQKNGFIVVKDSAKLLDGSVSQGYYTLLRM